MGNPSGADDKTKASETRLAVSASQGVQFGDHGEQQNFYDGIHHHYGTPAVSWPVVYGRAPLEAAAFQRRSSIRRAARNRPAPGRPVVTTHILSGEAGTGKTQLAAAIFREALRDGAELAVWITASSRTSVLAAYQDVHVMLNAVGGAVTDDAERAVERLLGWLTGTSRRWIFVLDDVADPA